MKLSDRLISSLKPTKKQQEIADSLMPGLQLRIMPSGVKSWAVRYRINGKQRRLSLGKYPAISLATARDLAREAMKQTARGTDVHAEKVEKRRAGIDTVQGAAQEFIERHAKVHNRSWQETERILNKYMVPAWKGRRLEDIARKDVITLIDGIHAKAPIMANRVLAHVRKFFNWCAGRDLIPHSPAAGVVPPAKERKRDRILTDAEMRAFWRACEIDGHPFGHAFRLLLATGQRRDEVLSMRWSEIDLKTNVWELPGSRTKNGKPHRIPLGPLALAILKDCPRLKDRRGNDVDLVFPAQGNFDAPASGISKAKERIEAAVLKALEVDDVPRWTLHDLRRTFASGCRRAGVALDVVEKLLNHTGGSFAGVVGVYQLHDYEDEKRDAMERWYRLLTEITGTKKAAAHG